MKKISKGEWGYISYQRKRVLLITLVLYVCAIGIYLFGRLSLNTTKNLFTIVAVLGILPASKSMVNLIMFLRFRSLPDDIHKAYLETAGDVCIIFETPFTTYEKTFFAEATACRNKTVICSCPEGLAGAGNSPAKEKSGKSKTADKAQDTKRLTEHLQGILKNEGYKDITVRIYDDREDFRKRLSELTSLKQTDERVDMGILNTLLSVVL